MLKKDLDIPLVLSANATIKCYCERCVLDYSNHEWLKKNGTKIVVLSHSHVKNSTRGRKASEIPTD